MLSRLETVDPRLQARIVALDAAKQSELAVRVAELTASRLGVDTMPEIMKILRVARTATVFDPTAVRALEQSVEKLDETAWELQDEGRESEYLQAFSRARAANAVLALAQDSSQERALDACYEAYAALGEMEGVAALFDGNDGNDRSR